MRDLLGYYERELAELRELGREFAQRYPRMASGLRMQDGEADDPHVKHFIEASALLTARIAKRIDDGYADFTEALLSLNFPHALRPFPSCSIASLTPVHDDTAKVARGASLYALARGQVACRFRSVYPVVAGPLRLAEARFSDACFPEGLRVPGASCALSLCFESGRGPLAHSLSEPIRIFIDTEPATAAALIDCLFLRTASVHIRPANAASWMAVPSTALRPMGFVDDESILPCPALTNVAHVLMLEYFGFPEKFHFFALEGSDLAACLPEACTACEVCIVCGGAAPDTYALRLLERLTHENFRLACTPIVNLFPKAASPTTKDERSSDYPLLLDATHPAAYDLFSIERLDVQRARGGRAESTHYLPFYSGRHRQYEQAETERYWHLHRDADRAAMQPGSEFSLSFLDASGAHTEHYLSAISVDVLATNRDLPTALVPGTSGAELRIEGAGTGGRMQLLRVPTRSQHLVEGAQWRLVAHLSLQLESLAADGGAALKELLSLHNLSGSSVVARQIAAIRNLELRTTGAFLCVAGRSSRLIGTECRLSLDVEAFAGLGLHGFIAVIDRLFGESVHLNSFTQLVVLSAANQEEITRCPPRNGSMSLV